MTWRSEISSRTIIIDDDTVTDQKPADCSKGYEQRPYDQIPLGSYAEPLGDSWLIPREEWYDRAQELERTKTRLSDFVKKAGWQVKNQNGLGYCWIFGVVSACEMTRIYQGQKHVQLSPASSGAKVKRFQNRGGWGDEAAEYIAVHGVCEEADWPEASLNRQYDKPEAWEKAKRYIIDEWNELKPRSLDHLMSCLLRGIPVPVGFNWWRHLVCAADPVVFDKPNGTSDREMLRCFGTGIANSWNTTWGDNGWGILKGTKQLADGQLAIRSMRLTTD